MLATYELNSNIESAIESAMKDAFLAALNASKNQDPKKFNIDDVAAQFADKAKTCANGISSAIEKYIKGAQIRIPIGSMFTPGPTLMSPTGPCTGSVTFIEPWTIINCIQ